jgi:hypothetical protein
MSNFLVGTNLADVQLDKFNGDTSTVAFTLSVASSTFSALVRISGVVQTPTDDFSIVNSTLTFTTAPPSGTGNIVVTYTKATQIGVPNDASVSASKLASNAVTLAKMASGTDGNIISYDASGNPVAIATGTDGQVLTSAGAGAQPAFEDVAAGGKVVQVVNTKTGAVASTTTTLPNDDTIPQNTEGGEFLTLAITPTSATNLLRVQSVLQTSPNGAQFVTAALFQDATASALAASMEYGGANTTLEVVLDYYMTAGTASATTFKVRLGMASAGTLTLNGISAGRKYGGVLISSLTITEIAA